MAKVLKYGSQHPLERTGDGIEYPANAELAACLWWVYPDAVILDAGAVIFLQGGVSNFDDEL